MHTTSLQIRNWTGLILLFLCSILVIPLAHGQRQELTFDLESIHASPVFDSEYFRGGRWAGTGPVIWFVNDVGEATNLMSLDLATEEQETIITGSGLMAPDIERLIQIEDYAYNADETRVLFYTDSERVWRQNTKGFYYIYDLDTGALTPLSDREKGFQMFAKWSPDGNHIAFVRDRNLFLYDVITGEEIAITDSGSEGAVINGTSDWVYEEEFGLRDGWSWSPDGGHVAFFQLDESNTRNFLMADLLGQYPELETFRYPKAGEANSEIRIGVYSITSGQTRFFDTDTWEEGGERFEYIPRMGWTPPVEGRHQVWLFRMNRDQNILDLMYADPTSGETRLVFTEEESSWIEVRDDKLHFLSDEAHFLWISEAEGYRHVYMYALDGTPVRTLTEGNWEVKSVAGVDEEKGLIYVTGTLESSMETHLYAVPFQGRAVRNGRIAEPRKITSRPGTHTINMSRDFAYYIDTYSSSTRPPVVSLHTISGEKVRDLEDNSRLIQRLEAVAPPEMEFMSVPGADGTPLNAYLIKPDDFDPGVAYPVLMYVYGGPGSQTVSNRWGGSRYLWHAMLANELDIIVASVDNRGTGSRGKAFKSSTYRKLGQIESADQIAAARYLGSLSYIDANRMGIWGWSYGGYMTLMSMLNGEGPDTFSFGMSVAPVTDWRQYDTIYTERYMSTPASNPEGYDAGAPLAYADRMKDHQRLLVAHGDFDDNVHFQNAAQMIKAFQDANKQFEFMMYPGKNHGISGGTARLHLFTLMTEFVRESINQPVVQNAGSN